MEKSYGSLNGHAVGIILKEGVRRVILRIRAERTSFQVTEKQGYIQGKEDLFTSADTAAQEIYVRMLRECFPDFGVVAEEQNLIIPSKHPEGLYFTVDPLDGTRAFVRKQSQGVGTMISLCSPTEVLAAYVGDVNTQEIYGFRPDSAKVHRISEFDIAEPCFIDVERPLVQQYALLRDPPGEYGGAVNAFLEKGPGRIFRSYEVEGGSIGIWMARLWKGEVGFALLKPSLQTPWDFNPIYGISRKLGFCFYAFWNGKLVDDIKTPSATMLKTEEPIFVIHETRVRDLGFPLPSDA